jgi:hypothetical protein
MGEKTIKNSTAVSTISMSTKTNSSND